MKLYPKGGKYVTGYFALIGSKEARDAGFLNEDGTTNLVKKIVDTENHRIIITLDTDADTNAQG